MKHSFKLVLLNLFIILCFAGFVKYKSNVDNQDNRFFQKVYERVTFQPFPASGEIIHKFSSTADLQGDYEACTLVRVSKEEYLRLEKLIDTNYPKEYNNIAAFCSANWSAEIGSLFKKNIAKKVGGSVSKWGLVQGEFHVYVLFYSW